MFLHLILTGSLFFVLVPGIIVRIPSRGTLIQEAGVHAVLFAVGVYIICMYILPAFEGFDNPSTKVDQPCPEGYKKCPSGDCVLKTDVHSACPA